MLCYVLARSMGAKDIELADFNPYMKSEKRIITGRDFDTRRQALPKTMDNEAIIKLWREKGRGEVERIGG